ncbi:MAG: SRPBCC family protein [Candidatus Neptunochlamydia sp.]|nr:SRPBCC family protein [Candidatus Neptunochlamydia sp.]
MCIFEHTVTIKALTAEVWQKLSDVESWPIWDSSLSWCKLSSSFSEGSVGALKPSGGPSTTFELVNVMANRNFDVRSKLPLWNKMIVGHRLEEIPQGTRLTHSIRFEGWLSCIFDCFIGKRLRDSLPSAMNSLKCTLENHSESI